MSTREEPLVVATLPAKRRSVLRPYVAIARPDHWVKNVFVLPGIVVALSFDRRIPSIPWIAGLLAVCLVASSNYVLNELLDAPFDREHPIKRNRPVPSGQVSAPIAYAEWIALMLAGIALGLTDPFRSAAYLRSFAFYTQDRLLISVMFYGCHAMLFFGAFLMRYRLELVLSFPLVAVVMAAYLALAFKKQSAAQNPEKLYREPLLMASVVACAATMTALFFLNVPLLYRIFTPTAVH